VSHSLLINPTALEAGIEAQFVSRIRASEAQRKAFMRFVETGLPHRRVEGWRWSDFRAAAAIASKLEKHTGINPFADIEAIEIQLTDDGYVVDGAVKGVETLECDPFSSEIVASHHPIAALNEAMTQRALNIRISTGAVILKPILIRDLRTAASSFAQIKLDVGPGARVSVAQSLESSSDLQSLVCTISVEPSAKVEHFLLGGLDGDGLTHLLNAVTVQERGAYHSTSLSTGGRLARMETHLTYGGVHAEATINSAALLSGDRHADFTTNVIHNAESCVTRQIHKGVARDRGRAVFQGKFLVNRPAQKTDAQMTANALLLSDTAEANHKPELEIYADDVECAHGSTAGALNEEALFYMRQRGLDEATARGLLIEAFVAEAFDAVEHGGVAEVFRKSVAAWLAKVRS